MTTTSRYARIQELGGTITPISAERLAVPLDAAKTPAGAARYPSPLRSTLPAVFKGGLFTIHSKSGALILMGRKAKGADPVALFALVGSVTLPPRMGLRALWRERTPDTVASVAERANSGIKALAERVA